MEVNDSEDNKAPQPINIGEILSQARDNLDLSSDDIANELNLAKAIISKIENNEFDQEIPLAFIRGYIKSYATRVGLDTRSILQEFDRQSGIESPSLKRVETISKFDIKRKEINSGNYLIKLISILLILVFVFFAGSALWKRFDLGNAFNGRSATESADLNIPLSITSNDDNVESVETVLNIAETNNSAATDLPNVKTFSNSNLAESKIDDVPSDLSTIQRVNDKQTPASQNNENNVSAEPLAELNFTSLELSFSADCWVKITDARDEVLALGVKTSGKNMALRGVKPFTAILGEPSAVLMVFDGKDFDLSGYSAGRRAVIKLN